MQLPNKLYSYKSSNLVFVPPILTEIRSGPVPLLDLYRRLRPMLEDATDFMGTMDCLYALGALDINDDGEVYTCL